MKTEITDEDLFAVEPKFFKDRDDPTRSLMAFGFAIGPGWRPLVKCLLEELKDMANRWDEVVAIRKKLEKEGKDWKNIGVEEKLGDKPGRSWIVRYFEKYPTNPFDGFEVLQVKEKFGGLRFYTNCTVTEASGAIRMATSLSYRICENCGSMDDVTTEPNQGSTWVVSWCSTCREKTSTRLGKWKK